MTGSSDSTCSFKGHQDRKTRYRNLPLMAQLNVDADTMANRFQTIHGNSRPTVKLTALAGVHLNTPQGTITSNYTTELRYQATHGLLLKVMRDKYDWTPQLTDCVNWRSHGAAFKKRMKRKSHFVKLVHGDLPTNCQLHRSDPIRRCCPVCANKNEVWTHVLRCRHPARLGWRRQLLEKIADFGQKWNTCQAIQAVFLDGVVGWLEHNTNDPYLLPAALYDEEFERLIETQNAIGWNQIFLGRFAWQWSDHQPVFYATRQESNPEKRRRSGIQWQTLLISLVWSHWYLLWKIRNADVHGVTTSQQAQAERRQVLLTLRALYQLKPHIEPSVQSLLMTDIREHAAKPTWHIQNWISVNESLIRASFKHVKKNAIQGMRSIRQYFQAR